MDFFVCFVVCGGFIRKMGSFVASEFGLGWKRTGGGASDGCGGGVAEKAGAVALFAMVASRWGGFGGAELGGGIALDF